MGLRSVLFKLLTKQLDEEEVDEVLDDVRQRGNKTHKWNATHDLSKPVFKPAESISLWGWLLMMLAAAFVWLVALIILMR